MKRKPKKILLNILALAVGTALVLLLELLLFTFGVQPLSDADPFIGFRGSQPLFIKAAEQEAYYALNPAKSKYFNPVSFYQPKPEGTFRIVSFGGSTTYGRPYIDQTSFPRWLTGILNNSSGSVIYENLNLGGISYASYRVERLAREMARYSPDLYVVYTGHNEFLEARTFEKIIDEPGWSRNIRGALYRSRIYSLVSLGVSKLSGNREDGMLGTVNARLEEIGGYDLYQRDEKFKADAITQYKNSLEKLLRFARNEGIPVVLCTLPSNLAGISPFKSEHRTGMTLEEITAWEDLFNNAEVAFRRENFDEALALAQNADHLDTQYAYLHYLRGHTLLQLGRAEEARHELIRAKEEDIVPLRALEVFNNIVRELAIDYDLPLADVEEAFRKAAPEGIPGGELFTDHVHPTIKGQQLVAWTILEALEGKDILPVNPLRDDPSRERVLDYLKREYDKISPRYRAMGYWGVGRVYHWAGKIPEAYNALLLAWQTVRDVAEIPYLLGDIELARGNFQNAQAYFREADLIGGEEVRVAYGLARVVLQLKDGEQALKILQNMPGSSKASARYLGLEGQARILLGDLKNGIANLEEAVQKAPGAKQFYYSLAVAYLKVGEEERASEIFGEYIALTGKSDLRFPEFRQTVLEPGH